MKSFRKIISIIPRRDRRFVAVLRVLMFVGGLLEALGIGGILPLLSVIGQPAFLEDHAAVAAALAPWGVTTHAQLIIAAALGLIAVYVVKELFLVAEFRYQTYFIARMQAYFAQRLMEEYLSKPYIFHVNHNTANILRDVGVGPNIVFSNIFVPFCQLFTEAVTAAVICLMLVAMDPFAAVLVAAVLGSAVFFTIKVLRRRIARQGQLTTAAQAQYLKWLNQGLGAVKETKILHRERFFAQAFGEGYTTYAWGQGRYLFLNQLPKLVIEFVVVVALLALIISKVLMGEDPMAIVSLLGVLALAAFRLMPSANRIIGFYNSIKYQMPYFHAIYPELHAIRAHTDAGVDTVFPAHEAPLPFANAIRVEHLAYAYPEAPEHPVLEDVAFNIPKGSFVGIIGPSGAGKTTFVDILLGLLAPTSGRITVDGADIAAHMHAWQENLAYVPQTIYLIDGTIEENVALGLPLEEIDEARVGRALQMAELADFVQGLPDGTKTQIGERGVKLSGGQRQRIGIARALYHAPSVLILDEATSALDNETEKSITDTILRLKGQITIISIAHRVSTLTECDFKVRFDGGRAEVIE